MKDTLYFYIAISVGMMAIMGVQAYSIYLHVV